MALVPRSGEVARAASSPLQNLLLSQVSAAAQSTGANTWDVQAVVNATSTLSQPTFFSTARFFVVYTLPNGNVGTLVNFYSANNTKTLLLLPGKPLLFQVDFSGVVTSSFANVQLLYWSGAAYQLF